MRARVVVRRGYLGLEQPSVGTVHGRRRDRQQLLRYLDVLAAAVDLVATDGGAEALFTTLEDLALDQDLTETERGTSPALKYTDAPADGVGQTTARQGL